MFKISSIEHRQNGIVQNSFSETQAYVWFIITNQIYVILNVINK